MEIYLYIALFAPLVGSLFSALLDVVVVELVVVEVVIVVVVHLVVTE